MPAIGIRGGVSTGKSTFCDCFGEILPAARFFDDDRVAHKLVDVPGIKKELVRECREKVFSDAGRITRIQTDGRKKIRFLSVLSAESAVAVQQKSALSCHVAAFAETDDQSARHFVVLLPDF